MTDNVVYPKTEMDIELEKRKEELAKRLKELEEKEKTNSNTNTNNITLNVVSGVRSTANVIEGIGDDLDKLADVLRRGIAKAEGKKVSKYVEAQKYNIEDMKKMLAQAVDNGETSILLDADKVKPEDYAAFKMSPYYNISEYVPTNCCGGFMGKLFEVGKIELSFNFTPKLV